MLLALFHIHVKSDEQPHHTDYRYENRKRDCANRPFKYRSCVHPLPQINTDRTQIQGHPVDDFSAAFLCTSRAKNSGEKKVRRQINNEREQQH
jgi:hypothetical protein